MHREQKPRRKSNSPILRTIAVWTMVSLLLQAGFYVLLNRGVANMMTVPTSALPPVALTLEAHLPDRQLENIQLSYAKDYLAYTADGIFKIYNLKQNKLVYSKEPAATKDQGMGVLNYHWLPDRNTLIYFFAKENPNPYTTILVPAKTDSPGGAKPGQDKYEKVQIFTPVLTYLNTLELPDGSEDSPPDERENSNVSNFPAGGRIVDIASSTYTNMIYLLIETDQSSSLLEIDVMQNARVLPLPEEKILRAAASDHFGTLYIQTKTGNTGQILAIDGLEKRLITDHPGHVLLGTRNGKLYIGEVADRRLTQIFTYEENFELNAETEKGAKLSSYWQGDIPFANPQVGIDSLGKITIYENQKAFIIQQGNVSTIGIKQSGESLLSPDGAVLINFSKQGNGTKVMMKPIK